METDVEKIQKRMNEFWRVLVKMSEKDWQSFLNSL